MKTHISMAMDLDQDKRWAGDARIKDRPNLSVPQKEAMSRPYERELPDLDEDAIFIRVKQPALGKAKTLPGCNCQWCRTKPLMNMLSDD